MLSWTGEHILTSVIPYTFNFPFPSILHGLSFENRESDSVYLVFFVIVAFRGLCSYVYMYVCMYVGKSDI